MPQGVGFRETMQGWFALGVETPEEGARLGQRDGHTLAMHAEVGIADVDRFTADRNATGSLSGEIEFAPLGGRFKAPQGIFQLFTPDTADNKTRRMVYELAFEAKGGRYYLAGEKQVRDDPGFDLWSDTTTLFTYLHEGTNRQGRVLGAGILTLGVPQLLAMLGSMRAIGDGGVGAVARFGSFFFGQIWDVYAPHALGGKDAL
jgi:cholesterol oxidase